MTPPSTPVFKFNSCNPLAAAMRIEIGNNLTAEAEAYLSPAELSQFARFKHPKRRSEWFTARLISKLLLEHYLSSAESDNSPFSWPPLLEQFGLKEVLKIPSAKFRNISVLPNGLSPKRSGIPYLSWNGVTLSNLHLSIAHAGGWAIACLSSTGSVGLDIEECLSRTPEFYECYFLQQERIWVEQQPRQKLSAIQLYTLLWTLKESYLKTGVSEIQNVGNLSNLSVAIDSSFCLCKATESKHYFDGYLHNLELQFAYGGLTYVPRAAFGFSLGLVLSITAFESHIPAPKLSQGELAEQCLAG